jgi:hypothetical protein
VWLERINDVDIMTEQGLFSIEEWDFGDRFLKDGYVISDVENREALAKIFSELVEVAIEYLGIKVEDPTKLSQQCVTRLYPISSMISASMC